MEKGQEKIGLSVETEQFPRALCRDCLIVFTIRLVEWPTDTIKRFLRGSAFQE
jgi:hypothetical protein